MQFVQWNFRKEEEKSSKLCLIPILLEQQSRLLCCVHGDGGAPSRRPNQLFNKYCAGLTGGGEVSAYCGLSLSGPCIYLFITVVGVELWNVSVR